MKIPADNVPFTPYLPTLRNDAKTLVVQTLGLPEGISLSWHVVSETRLHVVLGPPDKPWLEFDVEVAFADTRAWFKGKAIALSYRRGRDGADPMALPESRTILETVRQGVETLDGTDAGQSFRNVLARLEELRELDGIEEYYFRQARPRELVIRLGFRCNQDCWFCWQGRKWPEPPVEYYHTWLEQAARAGHRVVFFSGGEPTIHRELPTLIRRARQEFGMAVWIQTNAIQLGKARVMKTMLEAGLNGVFVSYHSANPDISDAMTRAPKTHALTAVSYTHLRAHET